MFEYKGGKHQAVLGVRILWIHWSSCHMVLLVPAAQSMVRRQHCLFETSLLVNSARKLQEQMQKTRLLLQPLPKVLLSQLHQKVSPAVAATKAFSSTWLGPVGVMELL